MASSLSGRVEEAPLISVSSVVSLYFFFACFILVGKQNLFGRAQIDSAKIIKKSLRRRQKGTRNPAELCLELLGDIAAQGHACDFGPGLAVVLDDDISCYTVRYDDALIRYDNIWTRGILNHLMILPQCYHNSYNRYERKQERQNAEDYIYPVGNSHQLYPHVFKIGRCHQCDNGGRMQVGDCRTILRTDLLPELARVLGCSIDDLFKTETPKGGTGAASR